MLPFLKWPGGKRWFVARHPDRLPRTYGRYFEPFLGAGSVFFHLEPDRAVLGDTNAELIATFAAIKRCWQRVESLLSEHQRRHTKRYYYRVRDRIPADRFERAARTIYLNRTCFNGIYRVNLDGTFNVPVGGKTAVVLDTDDFAAVARLLRGAELRVSDFEPIIDMAERNDLIFADPPYTVRHNNNGFVKYNETLFRWADQERLADALARARGRGVQIVATNADHGPLRRLYQQRGFSVRIVERYSSISASSESRNRYRELIILANCPGDGPCRNLRPASSRWSKRPASRAIRSKR
jgi:DNA adenine methylase